MLTRLTMVILILLAAGSACAESLNPDAARRFVAGKLFAFNCFDGSRGAGRIYGDGSVIGTIQLRGAGPERTVSLPAGTLRARGEAVCASLQGMPFEPCFHIEKTMTTASAARGWGLPIAISPAVTSHCPLCGAAPCSESPSEPRCLRRSPRR